MNEIAQDPNALKLPRWAFVLLLAVVALTPILAIVYLTFTLPSKPEQPLPGTVWITTIDDHPVLVLRNDSSQAMSNINLVLNDSFHFYSPQELSAGEELTVALGAFTKRSGLRFHPQEYTLMKIGVFARLYGGSRGVLDMESETLWEDLTQAAPDESSETPEKPKQPAPTAE